MVAGLFILGSIGGAILGAGAGYIVVNMRLDTLILEWKQAKQAYLTQIGQKGVEARAERAQSKQALITDAMALMAKGTVSGDEIKGLLMKHQGILGKMVESEL